MAGGGGVLGASAGVELLRLSQDGAGRRSWRYANRCRHLQQRRDREGTRPLLQHLRSGRLVNVQQSGLDSDTGAATTATTAATTATTTAATATAAGSGAALNPTNRSKRGSKAVSEKPVLLPGGVVLMLGCARNNFS